MQATFKAKAKSGQKLNLKKGKWMNAVDYLDD